MNPTDRPQQGDLIFNRLQNVPTKQVLVPVLTEAERQMWQRALASLVAVHRKCEDAEDNEYGWLMDR